MNTDIPAADEVRELLRRLSLRQLEQLAERSAVPMATLVKVRSGQTGDPRLNTVRRFVAHAVDLLEDGMRNGGGLTEAELDAHIAAKAVPQAEAVGGR